MNKNTLNAIIKRINNGEHAFFIGKYYYENDINGIIRRREQTPDHTPTSEWELVAKWNQETQEYKFEKELKK